MKKLISLFLLILALSLISCDDSDDYIIFDDCCDEVNPSFCEEPVEEVGICNVQDLNGEVIKNE